VGVNVDEPTPDELALMIVTGTRRAALEPAVLDKDAPQIARSTRSRPDNWPRLPD
jgi:hypothetical protein